MRTEGTREEAGGIFVEGNIILEVRELYAPRSQILVLMLTTTAWVAGQRSN